MLSKYEAALHTLVGFENNTEKGIGPFYNFIMSNGTRSTQRDEDYPTEYSFMMPKDALNKIKSVTIYGGNNCISAFSFFDKDGALLWKIGYTGYWKEVKETVVLAENEVIVGVVAKMWEDYQSNYTDFQFQIAFW